MIENLINWLEQHQMPCFYKQCFNIPCPGCGMQRAFVELLRGNLLESLQLYPALIPTIIMILFLFVHLIKKIENGAYILKFMFIFNASVIVLSYIYKLITL